MALGYNYIIFKNCQLYSVKFLCYKAQPQKDLQVKYKKINTKTKINNKYTL